MDVPRLHGDPIDQQVVAALRAKQRAREDDRAARRPSQKSSSGLRVRGLLQWRTA
jgi:hypothetical protein